MVNAIYIFWRNDHIQETIYDHLSNYSMWNKKQISSFRKLCDTNKSKRNIFKNGPLGAFPKFWNRCISEPFEVQTKVREEQTDTNDFLLNAVGPISISLKMTNLPSWRISEILKSLYLRTLWGTNESKRGTNGYKRFSFECRWSHFDIFKIG